MREGPVRGRRAARHSRLLPLHALPEADWYRLIGPGASRRSFASNPRGRGARPRLPAPVRLREALLRSVRLEPLQPQSLRCVADERPPRRFRLRSGRETKLAPVRRLRSSVGADSGRRVASLRRGQAWSVCVRIDRDIARGHGAAMESNHPSVGLPRPAGFEDQTGHQTPAAPRSSVVRRARWLKGTTGAKSPVTLTPSGT
jgi:hypothetical protein